MPHYQISYKVSAQIIPKHVLIVVEKALRQMDLSLLKYVHLVIEVVILAKIMMRKEMIKSVEHVVIIILFTINLLRNAYKNAKVKLINVAEINVVIVKHLVLLVNQLVYVNHVLKIQIYLYYSLNNVLINATKVM